jgi:hypothetical protein
LLGATAAASVCNLLSHVEQSHRWHGTSVATFSLCNGHA